MNKTQIIGVGVVIMIIGVLIGYLYFTNTMSSILGGVLTAIGISYIFKVLPLKKENNI